MTQQTPSAIGQAGAEIRYEGQTASSGQAGTPDTTVVVTDEHLYARPIPEAEGEGLDVTVPLADVTTLRCSGLLNRTVTLETDDETVTIPTTGLNEGRFREAIVEGGHLDNACPRLGLDKYGICPCWTGTCVGCLLIAVGIGLILTIVGSVLGVLAVGAGVGLIAIVAIVRKCSEWRGANVWQRANGFERPQ
jgi:hypothetical protein